MDFIEANRDLLYDENFKKHPRFKTVLIGGYGLQYILKYRHNIEGIIETKDIDIMVSTRSKKVHKLFLEIAKNYASKNNLTVFDSKNNITINNRTGAAVIDILITNKTIENHMFDQDISEKIGIPIFSEEYFLLELLQFVKSDNYVYKYRKPTKRHEYLSSAQHLCKLNRLERFRPYCDFLATVTIEKLSKMSREERGDYFTRVFNSLIASTKTATRLP